jgi:hypothetical protein
MKRSHPIISAFAITLSLVLPSVAVAAVHVGTAGDDLNPGTRNAPFASVVRAVQEPAPAIVRGPYLQLATPTSIHIRWRTNNPTDSAVQYGITPDNLDQTKLSNQQTTEHEIVIDSLQSDTRYFYSVGTTSVELAGNELSYTFITPPASGTDKSTRIWITGDSGTANADPAAVRDAYKAFTGTRPTDAWLMLGDIAYLHGTDDQYQAAFFDMYPELLRQTVAWPTFGNHDGGSADSDTQSGPYYEIFSLPTNGEAGGVASSTEAFYSFDIGIIHFISLDSFDSERTSGGSMIPWLIDDLTVNDKEWTIAFWHHPPYSKGSHDSDIDAPSIEMRENAVSVLESYGVDLVLSGHSHSYERTYLLDGHYGPSTTLESSMILDSGGGRDDEDGAYNKPGIAGTPHEGAVYAVAGSSGKISDAPLNHPAMYISLVELGSMVLDVSGNQLEATFLDKAATVRDSFTITKGTDTFSPTIVSVARTDEAQITILYSEQMDQLSTATTNNYGLNGLTLLQAALQPDLRTLVLTTTTPMTPGMTYILSINNVEDLAGNPIAADTMETFTISNLVTLSFREGVEPSSAYSGARDAFLAADQPNMNTGQASILNVDGDDPSGTGLDKSILLYWDLEQIPSGSTMESVSIEVDVSNSSNDTYSIYQMKRDWDETVVSWNQYMNDAPWETPGALGADDRGAVVLGETLASTNGVQLFSLNPAGVALVQSWIDNTMPNYGFIVADAQPGDGLDFWSSDALAPLTRPRLILEYHVSSGPDDDGDGTINELDNCIDVPNSSTDISTAGPSQNDSDSDGYGNICDADFDNNGIVNFSNLAAFRVAFGTTAPDADLNGDGIVNFSDLAIFRLLFGKPPGPSGIAP